MMTKNNKPLTPKQQALKERYEEFKTNINNPIKRSVYAQKVSGVIVSILRGFLLFGLSFIIIYPIFREVIVAIKDPQDLNNPLVVWIPEHFSLTNVKIAAELLDYKNALINNVKISLITASLQLLTTSIAGYAFARLKFKGSNIVFWIVMLTLLVPPQTVALSRSLFLRNFDIFGIFSSLNGGQTLALRGEGKDYVLYIMALFGQGIRAALFVYLFKQFFRGIPVELEESAQIDGAGVIRTFWSVMLPNARGCITTVSLFAFVWQWNDSYYIKSYGLSGDSFPLMTMRLMNISEWVAGLLKSPQYKHLYHLVGEEVGSNPYFTSAISNTAAFIMMLPLLVGYLFVQRLFIEGVERSGIVG
ncbi:MAG: carbohydrate ABC transporter permease [Erysipelotrichaceae bacterium]|nr:carbohydrate ABC transporter permease [Erysipelotrichaceae bacterium]